MVQVISKEEVERLLDSVEDIEDTLEIKIKRRLMVMLKMFQRDNDLTSEALSEKLGVDHSTVKRMLEEVRDHSIDEFIEVLLKTEDKAILKKLGSIPRVLK